MKCIESENTDRNVIAQQVEQLKQEISVFKTLNHIRIVKYYGFTYDSTSISILMEYMEGGSLHDKINVKGLNEKTASKMSFQILDGLRYLHEKDIVHRDIKGENILLDSFGNCKLADFGCSKMLQTTHSQTGCKTFVGTPFYISPEVINAQQCDSEYGKKCDIWSFGCTLVEMLTTKPPWFGLSVQSALYNTATDLTIPSLPDNSSSSCKTFVHACFIKDPAARPNASTLLTYDWIKIYNV